MSATITIAMCGDRSGFIIASLPRVDPYRMGERLVVGDVYRISHDGEPPEWKAWLWPLAGGNVRVTQSCDAATAISPERLRVKIQKRADEKGNWWKRLGEGE